MPAIGYMEMMSGAEEPVAIIFPQSASDGVEVLYQNSALAAISTVAAGVLRGIVRASAPPALRILEVSGGTGGTTAWLLPELNGVPALEPFHRYLGAVHPSRPAEILPTMIL